MVMGMRSETYGSLRAVRMLLYYIAIKFKIKKMIAEGGDYNSANFTHIGNICENTEYKPLYY